MAQDNVEVRSADQLRKLPQQPTLPVMMLEEEEHNRIKHRAEEIDVMIHDQKITMNKGNGFLVGHTRVDDPVWASFVTADGDGKFVIDAEHRAMIQFYVWADGKWSTDIMSLDNLENIKPCEWVVGESVNERWVHIYDTMVRWAKNDALG